MQSETTTNIVFCNNVVWKFNKTKKEPKALLRTKNTAVIALKNHCYIFKHFKPLTQEESINIKNILTSYVTDANAPTMHEKRFSLIDPISDKHDRFLSINTFMVNHSEDILEDVFSSNISFPLLRYMNDIGIALARTINSVIQEKYNSLSWIQKTRYKVFGDDYRLLEDIPLSDYIRDVMKEKFYDPAKNDPEISGKTIDDVTLVFRIKVDDCNA